MFLCIAIGVGILFLMAFTKGLNGWADVLKKLNESIEKKKK